MQAQLVEIARPGMAWLPLAPRSPRVGAASYVAIQLVGVPALIACLAWCCQYGGIDMLLSGLFAGPAGEGFALRDSLVLEVIGHQAARGLPVLVAGIALAAGLAGFGLSPLRPWSPILLTVGTAMAIGALAVNVLRGVTAQHCPIDLQPFGGIVDYVADQAGPFWATTSQSAGHCLPSGHAAGGYALLSLYFAGWAAGRPSWRWRGLGVGVGAGAVFSVVRIAQGAHFASATLWSAAILWATCAALFLPLLCRRAPTSA
jgi:membrane-associated PAP2 superfamily phosphatase